jgi:hypothetical protein
VKKFVIVTPVHPEVPPRNWGIHVPKASDMEKCGDLERPSHMLENTLFRGVFSNPWHLDHESSGSDIVIKSETQCMGLQSAIP